MQVTINQVRLLRMKAQRLIRFPVEINESVAQVAAGCFGVQAQELPAGHLGLHTRGNWLTLADIEGARLHTRTIVRTWMARGTLHLVSAEDYRWLLPLLAPLIIPGDRRRMAELGWDEERTLQGLNLLASTLDAEGSLTREEIIHRLKASHLPFEGQAPVHLIFRAAWEGILVQGPDRDKKPTFVSPEAWIGSLRSLPRDSALAELAHRYLEAYAPAGPEDLSSWSGVKVNEARLAWQAIDSLIIPVDAAGQKAWILKTQLHLLGEIEGLAPQVRLLPKYDNILLGYASRGWSVSPPFGDRVNPGGGIIYPTLMVDGRALGLWRAKTGKGSVEVIIEPFEALSPLILPGLEAEVARLEEFWGVKTLHHQLQPGHQHPL